ncbi:hypothetical protein DFS34DRAFT_450264 [Phlyctochytrium arcticum]|nr:hypothetical protein DFS34DRAFT_450264 [Phlyctochytrium arcticum]
MHHQCFSERRGLDRAKFGIMILLYVALLLPAMVHSQAIPVMQVKALNTTGVAGQANPLRFEVYSDKYKLKWENLKEVDGCRLVFVIVHQSFNSLIRQCPEDFANIRSQDDVFTIYPKLPFAGSYVISAKFTINMPNVTLPALPPPLPPLNVTDPIGGSNATNSTNEAGNSTEPASPPDNSTTQIAVPTEAKQTSMFLVVNDGPRGDPPPVATERFLHGDVPTGPDLLSEPWIYSDHAVKLPSLEEPADVNYWSDNGTFRVALSAVGGGKIKLNYCRPFMIEFSTINSTGFISPAYNFAKFKNQDAHIMSFRADEMADALQGIGYRVGEDSKFQPICSSQQEIPTFENTSNRIGFGVYFGKGGVYQVMIQAKINGYIVTAGFPVKVSNEEQTWNTGSRPCTSGWSVLLTIVAAIVFATFTA